MSIQIGGRLRETIAPKMRQGVNTAISISGVMRTAIIRPQPDASVE
jgi:hypothetical protein